MIRASGARKTSYASAGRRNVRRPQRQTSPYMYGSEAPGDFWQEAAPIPIRKGDIENKIARRRERAFRMNLRNAAFMGLLVAAVTLILIGYIKLQADLTRTSREVAALETQLTEMRAANNENYASINAGVDLEEIRRIATQELGMKNAEKDQIIIYSDKKEDMVRQVQDLGR